jgi:AcrR family transcriptional regulator
MTNRLSRIASRRGPTQQRARERVEQILTVAEAMIVEGGVGSLKTNEIAARAGVPVGSLYQYFAGLEELIAALVDRYHLRVEEEIVALFAPVESPNGFLAALQQSQQVAWDFLSNNRGYRELWCGAQSWAPLRELDWADTLNNADAMNAALVRVFPRVPVGELRAFCIMVCDSSGSISRMAIGLPELRDDLLSECYSMIVARFLEFGRRDMLGQ